MKKLFFLILLSASFNLYAGAKVSYLSVKDDIVYFSIAATKEQASPTCVTAENSDLWAVSLSESTGRAMYSIVVTAMAANKDITIESANDCGAIAGFERPLDVFVGTRGNVPIDTFKSCNDILSNDPSAQDGVYSIQPTVGQIQVYCDMEWDGGWTLVMRGKEGDTAGWSTVGALNSSIEKSPNGGTFKLADEVINMLVTQAYRVTDIGPDQDTIYFKNTCVYSHIGSGTADCNTSYNNLAWGEPFGGVSGYSGLQAYNVNNSNVKYYRVITSYFHVWLVGAVKYPPGPFSNEGFVDGNGTWWSQIDRGYSASFNMWVR